MTPSRARFVTVVPAAAGLAVVLAVLTPAASVVTLDVVGTGPHGRHRAGPPDRRARGVHRRGRCSAVEGADGAGQVRTCARSS